MAKLVLFIMLFMFQVGAVKASTWLVVGDSLSSAYGIAEEAGWVALLRKHMASIDPDVQVVNASISGETTFGGVERLPTLIDQGRQAFNATKGGVTRNTGINDLDVRIDRSHVLSKQSHPARFFSDTIGGT